MPSKKPYNSMPKWVIDEMARRAPDIVGAGKYDLHHALVDKGMVRGMPITEQRRIHHPCNILKIPSHMNASHANIPTRQEAYKMLCAREGKGNVDAFLRSFHWKSDPPVTVESLQ